MDDINHISEADSIEPTVCNSCGHYELSSGDCLECDRVVVYDDLISDHGEAVAKLLADPFGMDDEISFGDVDEPCKGCGKAVSTPLMLMPITVYCDMECFALRG